MKIYSFLKAILPVNTLWKNYFLSLEPCTFQNSGLEFITKTKDSKVRVARSLVRMVLVITAFKFFFYSRMRLNSKHICKYLTVCEWTTVPTWPLKPCVLCYLCKQLFNLAYLFLLNILGTQIDDSIRRTSTSIYFVL